MTSGRRDTGANGRPDKIDLSIMGIVSDAELLGIVDDLADENGWTSTRDVRVQLGEDPAKTPLDYRSGVGPRMSWLVRYGWLEKGEPYRDDKRKTWQTYRLTAMGQNLLENPKLTATFERTFQALNAAQRLRLTRELAEGGHESPDEIRVALRRQWLRSLGR
jgi:hypothetical protein